MPMILCKAYVSASYKGFDKNFSLHQIGSVQTIAEPIIINFA